MPKSTAPSLSERQLTRSCKQMIFLEDSPVHTWSIMTRTIISRRLSLRPITVSDVRALHRLWIDAQVRRFLWDDTIISLRQTEDIIKRSIQLFDRQGFGIWGVREHHLSRLIGFAGFWHFRTPPSLELLYGVTADHWNRGFATEASRCVIRLASRYCGFAGSKPAPTR